jgi:hypothetical protein
MGHCKWVDLAILIGMAIIYRVIFQVIMKVSEIATPIMKQMIVKCKISFFLLGKMAYLLSYHTCMWLALGVTNKIVVCLYLMNSQVVYHSIPPISYFVHLKVSNSCIVKLFVLREHLL